MEEFPGRTCKSGKATRVIRLALRCAVGLKSRPGTDKQAVGLSKGGLQIERTCMRTDVAMRNC